jgi:hypothetical protein
MTVPEVRTLEGPRDVQAVRRARLARRLGLGLLAALVLAGLAGLFGIRSAATTGHADGWTLSVRHAHVTRAGIAVPFHVRVEHDGGFTGPVTIGVDSALLERFDFQNFYPNPAKETASADVLYYEFDPPPGDVLVISLDARTAPDQNGSVGTYRVRLLDGSATRTSVSFRMWVVP